MMMMVMAMVMVMEEELFGKRRSPEGVGSEGMVKLIHGYMYVGRCWPMLVDAGTLYYICMYINIDVDVDVDVDTDIFR